MKNKVDKFIVDFVNGSISGTALYNSYKCTSVGGELRNLVRYGTSRAKEISRKALKRRGLI